MRPFDRMDNKKRKIAFALYFIYTIFKLRSLHGKINSINYIPEILRAAIILTCKSPVLRPWSNRLARRKNSSFNIQLKQKKIKNVFSLDFT